MYLCYQIYTSTDKLEGVLAELLAGEGFGNGGKGYHLLHLLLLLLRLLCFVITSHFALSFLMS